MTTVNPRHPSRTSVVSPARESLVDGRSGDTCASARGGADRYVSRWNTAPGQGHDVVDPRALGKLTRPELQQIVRLSDSVSVRTVPQLQARLEQIVDLFARRGDLRGVFPAIYAPTTARAWEARLAGQVADGATSDALALDFGKRFLDNLHAHLSGTPTTPAWSRYFSEAMAAEAPSFSLIARGMNAHLTVDLPAAIAATDVPASFHEDFVALGEVMAAGIPQMVENVRRHYGLDLSDLLQGYAPGRFLSALFGANLPSRLTFQELREIAWSQGQALRSGDLEAAHGLVDNEASYRTRDAVIDHLPM